MSLDAILHTRYNDGVVLTYQIPHKVPWAAIEFGAADLDAEIERIKEQLKRTGVNLPLDF